MAIRTITTDIFPENPDKWGRELSENIELEILLLNLVFSSLEQNNIDLEGDHDFAGIPRLNGISSIERKELLYTTTVNNTFLSIFRKLVVYLDKLLGLRFACMHTEKNPIDAPVNLEDFITTFPVEQYLNISNDFKLNFPGKIKMITTLPERTSSRLLAYNKIRVAFEHNNGIAKEDIQFLICTFEPENKDFTEGTIKGNFRLDKPELKVFEKNKPIRIRPQDVTLIAYDIKCWVIKDLVIAVNEISYE